MKKLLAVLLYLISTGMTWATVGGNQYLEFLGYEPTDKKVYLLRHYEDGRGRLPQLYYVDLKAKNPNHLIEVTSIYRNPKTDKIDIDQSEDNNPFTKQLTAIKNRLQPLTQLTPNTVKFSKLQIISKQVISWEDRYKEIPNAQKHKVPAYDYRYQLNLKDNQTTYQSQTQTALSYAKDLHVKQAFSIPNQPYKIVGVNYLGDQFETGYRWEDAVLLSPSR